MIEQINIEPLEAVLYAYLSSTSTPNEIINTVKINGQNNINNLIKAGILHADIADQLISQVIDSLFSENYLDKYMYAKNSTCKLTLSGRQRLKFLEQRMSITKELIRKKNGHVLSELNQMEMLFQSGEIVILPLLENNAHPNDDDPYSKLKMILCPLNKCGMENAISLRIPSIKTEFENLNSPDMDFEIFMAFAIMLTMKGVDVYCPSENENASLMQKFELDLFNPLKQPKCLPILQQYNIKEILRNIKKDPHE